MIIKTPTRFFFVTGASEGLTPLNAFDAALLNAGIGNTNLIKVTSILPPRCQQVNSVLLPQGALVPAAYAHITSENPDEIISAAVAVSIPEDEDKAGLIMEYAAVGRKHEIEGIVREMVLEGMSARNRAIKEIKSCAIEYQVKKIGSVFAGVVLWE